MGQVQMHQVSLEKAFDDLLEEIRSLARRESGLFDERAAGEGHPIVLYGAGNLGRRTLAGLRKVGVEPLAFCDVNAASLGPSLNGLPVLAPDEAASKYGEGATFVVTIWSPGAERSFRAIREQLVAKGCRHVEWFVPLFWKYQEALLPHCHIHAPHRIVDAAKDVAGVFAQWADEASRIEYLAQLRLLVSLEGGSEGLPPSSPYPAYFPFDLFRLAGQDVFVDGGAYDGDTIRSYLEHHSESLRKLLAFEPDPLTFQLLERSVSQLPAEVRGWITLQNAAIGQKTGTVRFDAQGTVGSAIQSNGSLEIECVGLDEVLQDFDSIYVKMDIEGAELEALQGMRRTIASKTPILAICVYHLQEHLWEIPRYIRELSDAYALFLRRHGDEFGDLVCYAIPKNRLSLDFHAELEGGNYSFPSVASNDLKNVKETP